MEKDLFQPIIDAILKVKEESLKDNQDLEFVCSFVVFNQDKIDKDKDDIIDEDRIFAFGVKESLKAALEGMIEEIGKEKDDFINW